jgi:glutamyl-Q tRNA(Asp) synthetase
MVILKCLKENARIGVDGLVYPGTCRERHLPLQGALRFRVPASRVVFDDLLAGRIACDIAHECGDFVLRRADGVYTYQLAVTVDDAELGVSHVVRGADLLASTPRQIVLQQVLGYSTPSYLHLPVALNADGGKLSKQTLAAPIDDAAPLAALLQAAAFLGLDLPGQIGAVAEFWRVGIAHWQRMKLPPVHGKKWVES